MMVMLHKTNNPFLVGLDVFFCCFFLHHDCACVVLADDRHHHAESLDDVTVRTTRSLSIDEPRPIPMKGVVPAVEVDDQTVSGHYCLHLMLVLLLRRPFAGDGQGRGKQWHLRAEHLSRLRSRFAWVPGSAHASTWVVCSVCCLLWSKKKKTGQVRQQQISLDE